MKVGLVVNRTKPEAARFVPKLVRWLRSEGHQPVLAASTAREFRLRCETAPAARVVKRVDLVVALGGDGTLLRAARLVGSTPVPIMGVNLGGIGFMTAFPLAEATRGIAAVARGRHAVETRMVLACRYGRHMLLNIVHI